jgi:hypothetical protein
MVSAGGPLAAVGAGDPPIAIGAGTPLGAGGPLAAVGVVGSGVLGGSGAADVGASGVAVRDEGSRAGEPDRAAVGRGGR